jgi:hypothetical protein
VRGRHAQLCGEPSRRVLVPRRRCRVVPLGP